MIRLGVAMMVAAAALAVHVATATAVACLQPTKHGRAACLVNRARAARGLRVLSGGGLVHESSRVEAVKVRRCGFSHSPCGTSWTASLRPYTRRCRWWTAGEALGEGYRTARAVVDAWLASAPHRAVLMDGRVRRIGVAHHLGVWVLHVAVCR